MAVVYTPGGALCPRSVDKNVKRQSGATHGREGSGGAFAVVSMRQHSNSAFPQKLDKLDQLKTTHVDHFAQQDSARTATQAQRRVSADEVAELIAKYEAGATVKELAVLYGLHRGTVSAQLTRHGVDRPPRGLSPEQTLEAARLYITEEWSLARIGEHLGVSSATVRHRLIRAGISLRPRRGWSN